MPTDTRYIFRIPSPSKFTDTEEKIERLTKDINRVLDEVGTSFRKLSGLTGVPVPFAANIDMQGNRVTRLGDPREPKDATHKKYVDEEVEELRTTLDDVQRTIHSELPVSGRFNITLTRAVPTVVDDTIALGAFTLVNDAHSFDIAISVSANGFSVAKAYTIVAQRSINAAWEIALPLVDTGDWSSQDFDLDIFQDDATNTLALRIRRTAGTTAGLATIQIGMRGSVNDLFLESTATASVTAPTAILESARLMVKDGDVFINTQTTRAGVGTALTIRGVAGGDNRAGIELENPDPGINSPVGELRCFSAAEFITSYASRTEGALDAGAAQIWTKATGVALALALHITSLKNIIIGGGTAAGTSAQKVVMLGTGVAPGSSPADAFQLYSADIVAGNAAPHFRTENGTIIKLFTAAALVASDAGVIDATWDAAEQAILANVRDRLIQLEDRLQAHGLLL